MKQSSRKKVTEMVKIWIDRDEYHIYSYQLNWPHGKEVEITEEELHTLEKASEAMLEAQKILCRLMGTILEEEGFGNPPNVWP